MQHILLLASIVSYMYKKKQQFHLPCSEKLNFIAAAPHATPHVLAVRSSPVCDCALTVARTHTHKRFFSPRERERERASLIVAVHGGPRTTAWPRERKDRGRERELKGESEREAKERVLCAHEGGGGRGVFRFGRVAPFPRLDMCGVRNRRRWLLLLAARRQMEIRDSACGRGVAACYGPHRVSIKWLRPLRYGLESERRSSSACTHSRMRTRICSSSSSSDAPLATPICERRYTLAPLYVARERLFLMDVLYILAQDLGSWAPFRSWVL